MDFPSLGRSQAERKQQREHLRTLDLLPGGAHAGGLQQVRLLKTCAEAPVPRCGKRRHRKYLEMYLWNLWKIYRIHNEDILICNLDHSWIIIYTLDNYIYPLVI